MKKHLLSYALPICILIPCALASTSCAPTNPSSSETNGSVVYTVSEEEWKINMNLTNDQTHSNPSNVVKPNAHRVEPLTEINSYTVLAEGVNAGAPGSALLKMAENGMSIEFYVNGTLKDDETGTFDKNNVLYQSVKTNMMMFVPFKEYYDSFTFDETKNTYVAQNLTAEIVDDYDLNNKSTIYHKKAEVSFINGYLNTVSFVMFDSNFNEVFATFTFSFSDINNTVVEL